MIEEATSLVGPYLKSLGGSGWQGRKRGMLEIGE